MDKFSEAVKELVTKAGIASDKADYDRIKDEYIDLCWEAGIETIRNGTQPRPANPCRPFDTIFSFIDWARAGKVGTCQGYNQCSAFRFRKLNIYIN